MQSKVHRSQGSSIRSEQSMHRGEFNDWDTSATEMTRLKSGAFTATLELDKDKDHQFRYLVDENYWINEEDADGFVPSNIGSEQNCVISL